MRRLFSLTHHSPRTSSGRAPSDGAASTGAAASSVSLRIVAAMSAICVLGGVLLVVGVVMSSRHEFAEDGIAGKTQLPASYDAWVIDRNRAVAFVVAFVVCAVVASGVIGWYFARQRLVPMEDVIRLQRHFVADASHELKTPLAVMSLRIDTVEWHLSQGGGVGSDLSADVTEDLRQLREDVDGMDAVVNDLLSATQSAASGETSRVAVSMRKAASAVEPLGAERNVSIHVEVLPENEQAVVNGGETGLTRCLVAVLDNAVAHSPQDSQVRLSLEVSKNRAVVRVEDRGAGISGDPERLFTRFVREDLTSNREEGGNARAAGGAHRRGYGLGLALVRDIAHRYGGTVDVESTGPQGTVMALRFPLSSEARR